MYLSNKGRRRPSSFCLKCANEEWLVGDDPLYLKFWAKLAPLEQKTPIFIDIRSFASAVTPSEKSSINTNRKSTTHYPMGLRWTSYVAPKSKKGAKFRLKLCFTWRKYAKFLCVKTISDNVVRHSLAYLSVQKWFAGDVPTLWKFSRNWPTLQKRRFPSNIRS